MDVGFLTDADTFLTGAATLLTGAAALFITAASLLDVILTASDIVFTAALFATTTTGIAAYFTATATAALFTTITTLRATFFIAAVTGTLWVNNFRNINKRIIGVYGNTNVCCKTISTSCSIVLYFNATALPMVVVGNNLTSKSTTVFINNIAY